MLRRLAIAALALTTGALNATRSAGADDAAPKAAEQGDRQARPTLRERLRAALEDADAEKQSFHVGPFHPKLSVVSAGAGVGPHLHFWLPDLGATALDVHASGAYSIRRYQYYELQLGRLPHRELHLPRLVTGSDDLFPLTELEQCAGGQRYSLYASARHRRYPREDFYGLGPEAPAIAQSDYELRDSALELAAVYSPRRRVSLTARLGLLATELRPGSDAAFPDTHSFQDDVSAPGLAAQPDFFYAAAGVFADWRDEQDNPHRGSLLGAALARFDDRGGDAFRWTRLAFDARHFRPIVNPRHVLALRFTTVMDWPDEGSRVPFYMHASLGGSQLLRGFHSFRFRDLKLVSVSAEYRFEAWRTVELALLYDAGQVYGENGVLDLGRLEKSYGVGVRLKTPKRVRLRIDLARSHESTRLHVKFTPSF
jgi:hypothetical protein